ncbi:MAG: hypothetical protein QXX19_08720 [Candidatus Caldarchaeum sp.]
MQGGSWGLKASLVAGVLAWLALGPFWRPSQEQVLKVPQDFPTIQAALDAAPEGALILIAPGVYRENLKIAKSLTLEGSGIDVTILEPVPRDENSYNPIITVSPSRSEWNLSLKNLTLRRSPLALSNSYGRTPGVKIIETEQAVTHPRLTFIQTKWEGLWAILTRLMIDRLTVQKSIFVFANIIEGGEVREAEIASNVMVYSSFAPFEGHHVVIRDNVIHGEISLDLALGGEAEIVENIITNGGIFFYQEGERARWIVRRNYFEYSPTAIAISVSGESLLDALIEENRIKGGNIGIQISLNVGSWPTGKIQLIKNLIMGLSDYDWRFPQPSRSAGIDIISNVLTWPPEGPVEIEISENTIMANRGCGVALDAGSLYQINPPRITGRDNELAYNEKGDLCPPDYPWPPGFRK